MRIPYDFLKARIRSAVAGTASRRELTELVHFARAIVQSHLEHVRRSVGLLCDSQGLSIEDLAYDCLAGAFIRNAQNKLVSLESFVSSFEGVFESHTDNEVFLAFRSFLVKVTEQHIAGLFAQVDPAAGKIHRNARAAAVQSGLFTVKSEFRGVVLRPVNSDMLDHLAPFPLEELERQLLVSAGAMREMNDLVQALHSTIVNQNTYRRSIPLYQITGIFKRLFASDLGAEQMGETLPLDGLSQTEIEIIKDDVKTVLRQKMLVTYVMKGKTDPTQTKAILDAFDDLLDDWVVAKVANDGLFKYLRKHYALEKADYLREYRTKMEYLLRIVREEFQARLMKEL